MPDNRRSSCGASFAGARRRLQVSATHPFRLAESRERSICNGHRATIRDGGSVPRLFDKDLFWITTMAVSNEGRIPGRVPVIDDPLTVRRPRHVRCLLDKWPCGPADRSISQMSQGSYVPCPGSGIRLTRIQTCEASDENPTAAESDVIPIVRFSGG
jgi:hypothetical protein